jgi:hypothetical protein
MATPMGFWGLALLTCMCERDRERAWSRARPRVQVNMDRAGWWSFGGDGAREGERACLGTMRGAERLLRALVCSERQREDGGLEVVCLRGCQSGARRGLGFDP